MSMDYKYEAACIEIFVHGSNDVLCYVGPKSDSDVDLYYESLKEVIRRVPAQDGLFALIIWYVAKTLY